MQVVNSSIAAAIGISDMMVSSLASEVQYGGFVNLFRETAEHHGVRGGLGPVVDLGGCTQRHLHSVCMCVRDRVKDIVCNMQDTRYH